MDRKSIYMASIIAVVGMILALAPIAMAAGGTGSGSAGGHGGSSVGASGHGGGRQGDGIYSGDDGPDAGYWPGGGPAGSVAAWNGRGPHHKGWIGGPKNPWIYGGSNDMGSFSRGSLSDLTWPASYYSSGNYWRHGP